MAASRKRKKSVCAPVLEGWVCRMKPHRRPDYYKLVAGWILRYRRDNRRALPNCFEQRTQISDSAATVPHISYFFDVAAQRGSHCFGDLARRSRPRVVDDQNVGRRHTSSSLYNKSALIRLSAVPAVLYQTLHSVHRPVLPECAPAWCDGCSASSTGSGNERC